MFRQVYFHRTLRAAEIILQAILRRALHLFRDGQPVWYAPGTAFERILNGDRLTLAQHLELDDTDVVYYIKQWQRSSDQILSDLCRRFLNRRLFKAFDLDMPENERDPFVEDARDIVRRNGFDPDYYFVEDKAGDVPHYFYTSDRSKPKNLIYVEDGFARPHIREISEISSAVRGLQAEYRIHRICFPAELTDEIGKLYHA
jgi:HD superfamily phosphohydrolase